MATKLTEITTKYHTFVDNQVLTKDQLNEFINYFEDQDRMSRVFLTGVGIVCGFQLSFNASDNSITVSQGTGITTDGDLIKLRSDIPESSLKSIDLSQIKYTHYKKFEDNKTNYSFFRKKVIEDGNEKLVPFDLWEILPQKTDDEQELGTFSGLQEMVVLLYLESYAKEGDLCTAIDCDNQGIEQVARLRVLLVSKADAAYIAGLDSIYSGYNYADDIIALPEIAVARAILNSTNSANYPELKKLYYSAIFGNSFVSQLSTGITKLVQSFGDLLNLNISASNLNSYKSKLNQILNFSAYNVPFDIQYRYDFVKDLVDTYDEIKSLLLELRTICNPDINAFPKHLMLGCISEINNDIKHYRHKFYKSPALDCGTETIEKCRSLTFRLFDLITRFQTSVGETKITPSNKLPELTHRSIPFYYNIQESLLRNWDSSKTRSYRYNYHLCYHTSLLAPALKYQQPLKYNIDTFDFYRIEGHQGKDYQKVLEELDTLKTANGLAFDVKALSVNINTSNLNIDDYECEFEDLQVLLKAWTAEQNCILAEVADFFSSFSTAVPGANKREPELEIKRSQLELLNDSENFSKGSIRTNIENTEKVEKITAKETVQPTIRTNFKVVNVVADNMNTSEDALGLEMKKAIDANKGGSVNDIIASARKNLELKVNTEAWNQEPELKAFVVDKSVELMAYTHVLSQRMPDSLVLVDSVRVRDYKLSLSDLCALVKRLKAGYNSTKLADGLKAFIGLLINQLSTVCCSGKKLETLLEEISNRKESILVRLQLSKFVEKHPGLEHKAGVEPGGTFILVYLNKSRTDSAVADVALEEQLTFLNESKSSSDLEKRFLEIISKTRESAAVKGAQETAKEKIGREAAVANSAQTTDIPNNTVVADFCLPYMCCSDCAPVNFIIQKTPVSLRLEKDEFCLGNDSSPLLFEVTPADGVIKADVEIDGLTIDGVKLSLDPETFPNEMLGKPIHFTVNDQITNCQLTVYRGVLFDFAVPESPTSQTSFLFQPTGDLKGASFLWSFGDDSMSTEMNPRHDYVLPVNDKNKVTVSLTVTAANGICHSTVEHDIEFKVEETRIALDKTEFCENDKENYPFLVTPQGTEVKIEGKGVLKTANGFSFLPSTAGAGEVEFLLNGQPSGVIASVFAAPLAKFTGRQIEKQLILTNTSVNATSFIWLINEKEEKQDNMEPFVIELNANSPRVWAVQLTAIGNEVCGSNTSAVQTFETKTEEPQISLDKNEFCGSDKESYSFIVTPAGADVKIEGPGVTRTDNGFVFTPAAATPGQISFTLNGEVSGLVVTVRPAPVARFTGEQVGNQLVLTNSSLNATSFTWTINEEKQETTGNAPLIINLGPNSPGVWTVVLEARGAEVCGSATSRPVTFETKFNDSTEPVDNCMDETKAAILLDFRSLANLNMDSDIVNPIWQATSGLYGGSRLFPNGVLNDIDKYLAGAHNNELTTFLKILLQTSDLIRKVGPNGNKEEFTRLVELFALQLKLYYNVLACQSAETIKASGDVLQRILEQIIQILQILKEIGVVLPDSLKSFIKSFSVKVSDIPILVDHLKKIIGGKLI